MEEFIADGTCDGSEEPIDQFREQFEQMSVFRLFRLRNQLDQMIEDPERIRSVRSRIQLGDRIEYFDGDENRMVSAIVEKCRRTRASVRNLDDGVCWSIEYASINVDLETTHQSAGVGQKLSREQVAVGDLVGFVDKQNRQCVGKVTKRNPKTAGILCEDGKKWRVSYGLLFSVLDADGVSRDESQPLLDLREIEFRPSS